METLTVHTDHIFNDTYEDKSLIMTTQETVENAIGWIEDFLLPEAFDDEVKQYQDLLDLLENTAVDLKCRYAEAVGVLAIVNIHEM